MRAASIALLALLVGSASIVGCAAGDESLPAPPVAKRTQPILGGSLDTTTQSAVAVGLAPAGGTDVYGVCTGSLVKVDRTNDVAYILTAAHCASGDVTAVDIRIGNDWQAPDVILPAAQVTVDERYALSEGQAYDFAVVAVRGLPAQLPTPFSLPSANDGLDDGDPLFVAGYGNTISYGDPEGRTRLRKSKQLSIDSLSETIIYISQPQGGLCDGDSGGPALVNNKTVVVGVASYVSGASESNPCVGQAASARVSSGLGFINAVLNGETPPPPEACFTCRTQAQASATCRAKGETCDNTPACVALLQCLQSAESQNDQGECFDQLAAGVGPLFDWLECPCADECASECAGKEACEGVQKCAFEFQTGAYNTCMQSSCCAEMDAAFGDSLGYRCLAESPTPSGCSNNQPYRALMACSASKCEDDTGSSSSGGRSSSSSGGDQGDDDSGDDDSGDDDSITPKGDGKDEGGCSTSGARFDASWLALVGAVGLIARRRRR